MTEEEYANVYEVTKLRLARELVGGAMDDGLVRREICSLLDDRIEELNYLVASHITDD